MYLDVRGLVKSEGVEQGILCIVDAG